MTWKNQILKNDRRTRLTKIRELQKYSETLDEYIDDLDKMHSEISESSDKLKNMRSELKAVMFKDSINKVLKSYNPLEYRIKLLKRELEAELRNISDEEEELRELQRGG